RGEKAAEVGRERGEVGDALDRRMFALPPPVDRPQARVAAARRALSQWLGDRQRQLWREHRQPPVLLVDLQRVLLAAGYPHRQVVAESERRVVPPVERDRRAREDRPLRERLRDEHP